MVVEGNSYLTAPIEWEQGDDPEYPYEAEYKGHRLLARLNDFPAEELYTLIADGEEITNFDDWPASWTRPGASEDSVIPQLSAILHPDKLEGRIDLEELRRNAPLKDILRGLSDYELHILHLATVDGLSPAEIAEKVGENSTSLRYNLTKVYSKVRSRARRYFKETGTKSLSKKDA
jgi:hypothetical protein